MAGLWYSDYPVDEIEVSAWEALERDLGRDPTDEELQEEMTRMVEQRCTEAEAMAEMWSWEREV